MTISKKTLKADLVVVGGGMAGICAAVAAARNGISVILVQDRPVLGGNASSEMRMWICGAQGPDDREGGLIEELMLMNYHDNPELKYSLWDGVMYSFVAAEKNIVLLLNTSVRSVSADGNGIRSVAAWDTNAYTEYQIFGKFFADCSGDSILRLSGAEYRVGREARSEFNESHAPEEADSKTMGSSILVQLRRTKRDVPFHAPDWAYHFTDETMLRKNCVAQDFRHENFWWMEFGGVKDTVADADEIRHELLKIAYGTWEYIKNSHLGDAGKWELDWIGALPGKRESARYVGDHIMTQGEIEAGGKYPDVIAHGGWPMDDHNPKAFFTSAPPTIFHPAPSPFGIPYRSLYSKNVPNLFFAGRNISVSHMALSATRVMGTCAVLGQAVGTAAAIAVREGLAPRGVYEHALPELQSTLMEQDQFIPGKTRRIPEICARAGVSHEVLRSGIERRQGGNDSGIWLGKGETCGYEFAEPARISSFRIISDSDFSDKKQQRCYIADDGEDLRKMPGMLLCDYSIEVRNAGKWEKVFCGTDNRKRCILGAFRPVCAEAVRLVVDSQRGESKIHVFAFDVK